MSELTLVEFLTQRLDEDEAAARGVVRLRPEFRGNHRIEGGGAEPDWLRIDGKDVHIDDAMEPAPPDARVLVEVQAKRAIVAAYENDDNRGLYNGCGDDCEWKALGYVLRVLASVFSDHPDYRQEWTP